MPDRAWPLSRACSARRRGGRQGVHENCVLLRDCGMAFPGQASHRLLLIAEAGANEEDLSGEA